MSRSGSSITTMFGQKSLTDVVKGIRATKRDTALYISGCIAEIKTEINSTDPHVKAIALQKLTFLQMMGYDMSWASFASIEVMSSPRFAHKRIGYLAASQGFTQNTEVILLTTNLLKKELRGAVGGGMIGVYEAGLAINCLSNIVTEDLARELLPDLTNLTSHPQPYLRKKAVLCMFKLFVKYPQGLRLTFARIQQCLEDPHPSVVSCAVNVITELSDKNPKNYLPLAPAFFNLLTSSSNNWMLIKVVKLLGSLVPEEPRLARKLLEPLAGIVRSTQAKSLLYEAVYTITLSLPYCRKADGSMPSSVPTIVDLCAKTLRSFVEETDQNLKYLGLVGFGSLMSSHPRVLSAPDYRPLILACLSDDDVTIRTRALDLLTGMATRKNLMELVTQLLRHVDQAAGSYKCDLVEKIVEMCSADKYALLQDFAWYLDVLVSLGHTRGIERHGGLVAGQVVDAALRVLPVRAYAVRRMMRVLIEAGDGPARRRRRRQAQGGAAGGGEGGGGEDPVGPSSGHVLPEMLPAAAWIVGEYSHLIAEAVAMEDEGDDDDAADEEEDFIYDASSKGPYHSTIQALTAPYNVSNVATTTQGVYVQAAVKVLAAASNDRRCKDSELDACVGTLAAHLPVYMESTDVEVQERAFTLYHMLSSLGIVGAASGSGVPGLARVGGDGDEDGSSSSSSEEEGLDEGGSGGGNTQDLLNLVMSSPADSGASKKGKSSKSGRGSMGAFGGGSSGSGTAASKCRAAAAMLKYLLTPEPMKPVSAKAQRKKRQSPPAMLKVHLDEPVKMSVFSSLLEGERSQRPARGKESIEAVSFTQQRPMRTSAAVESMGGGGGGMSANAGSPGQGGDVFGQSNGTPGGGGGTFQHSGMPLQGASSQQARRPHDPFYLNSGGEPCAEMGEDGLAQLPEAAGRFGTIQLLDSDEDESGRRKKHKRKKEKKKKKGGKSPAVADMGEADMAFLSLSDTKREAQAGNAIVHSSDEGDEDDDDQPRLSITHRKDKKGSKQLKEFEGLAMVDLSTPLREDEVMPRNEHRVVPERPAVAEASLIDEDVDRKKAKKKKKKKKKRDKKEKSSKKEKRADAPSTSNATEDLLGFGGLMAPSEPSPAAAAAPIMGGSGAAISSAFDDLLDLEAAPAPTLGNQQQPPSLLEPSFMPPSSPSASFAKVPSSKKKGGKRLWQKGSIKTSHATGSGEAVDWGKVSLLFKTHLHGKSTPPAATISLRLINHSDDKMLQNVKISISGADDVTIEDVEPGNAAESSKSGPFQYSGNGSVDVRGSISASGSSVPFKVALPSTMLLRPVSGISHDQMLDELTSGEWVSHSVKIDQSSGVDARRIKTLIGSFLRAEEVDGGSSNDFSGTFAAASSTGVQVRALVKVKESSGGTKIDIKCTDGKLGKVLASDLKKVVL